MPSNDTEREIIGYTNYKGQPVAIVGRGRILGSEYYDIRFEDGTTRTVPALACDADDANAKNRTNRKDR